MLLHWIFPDYLGQYERMHQFYALLALCEGNPPVTSGYPLQMVANAENVL